MNFRRWLIFQMNLGNNFLLATETHGITLKLLSIGLWVNRSLDKLLIDP